jgi:hypothetical protein
MCIAASLNHKIISLYYPQTMLQPLGCMPVGMTEPVGTVVCTTRRGPYLAHMSHKAVSITINSMKHCRQYAQSRRA